MPASRRAFGVIWICGVTISVQCFRCSSGTTTATDAGTSADSGSNAGDDGGLDAGAPDASDASAPGADSGNAGDGAVMLCDQPDPLVASPNGPHGIYVVEFAPSDYNAIFLTQPTICGANVFVPWSTVDKGPDAGTQYVFSAIDVQIAPWKNAGKKVNLLLDGVGFGNHQTVTPGYVLASVPTLTCNGATPYPEVWTSGYIGPYEGFIRAVIDHYGSDPDIGYIRVGLSVGAQADVTCVPALQDAGLTESIFEAYVATVVAFEASIPHTVQLMLATGPYGTGGPNGDVTLPDFEAPLAVDAGFGFGNQGLSGQDITSYPHCNANWCVNFDTYAGRVPLYLQTLAASDPDGGGIGSLVPLLPFAMSHHTQIFEIYSQDLGVAYDPANPWHAQYGAAYQQLFSDTASVLGVSP
jgi:hypothetical protein